MDKAQAELLTAYLLLIETIKEYNSGNTTQRAVDHAQNDYNEAQREVKRYTNA